MSELEAEKDRYKQAWRNCKADRNELIAALKKERAERDAALADRQKLLLVVKTIGQFSGGDDPLTLDECVRLCEAVLVSIEGQE